MAIDFALSEEQQLVKQAVRDALKPFLPRREELQRIIFKEQRFPDELWAAICDVGLMGCLVPEEYGGNGLGLLAMTLGVEEFVRAGFGNALIVTSSMDAACVVRCGTEEQKKRLLPALADGSEKWSFALTEPNAGSNAFRIETMARRDGDSWKLSGQKTFITGADVTDKMLVVARTTRAADCKAQGLPKVFGLAVFILDTGAAGIELKPIPTQGIEGQAQFSVFFDDAAVPAENLIGEADQGSLVLFNSLNPERIIAAGVSLGLTDYLLDKAVAYASSRCIFGNRTIAGYQSIQHPLAEIKIRSEAIRTITQKAAWSFDRGDNPAETGQWANMAKFLASNLGIDAADRAIQTHGGYGFSEEYGVIEAWTSARLLRTAPISNEMILNFVGEHVLGMPRSY